MTIFRRPAEKDFGSEFRDTSRELQCSPSIESRASMLGTNNWSRLVCHWSYPLLEILMS